MQKPQPNSASCETRGIAWAMNARFTLIHDRLKEVLVVLKEESKLDKTLEGPDS